MNKTGMAMRSVMQIAGETGGAAAMAGLLIGAYRPEQGERIGALVCGGNVDPPMLAGLARPR